LGRGDEIRNYALGFVALYGLGFKAEEKHMVVIPGHIIRS